MTQLDKDREAFTRMHEAQLDRDREALKRMVMQTCEENHVPIRHGEGICPLCRAMAVINSLVVYQKRYTALLNLLDDTQARLMDIAGGEHGSDS